MVSRNRRKERIGIVSSDKMDRTIIVRIDRTTKHPVYKKIIKRTVTVMAHDEKNEAKEGDKVRIQATRPLSKKKNWRLVEILK